MAKRRSGRGVGGAELSRRGERNVEKDRAERADEGSESAEGLPGSDGPEDRGASGELGCVEIEGRAVWVVGDAACDTVSSGSVADRLRKLERELFRGLCHDKLGDVGAECGAAGPSTALI